MALVTTYIDPDATGDGNGTTFEHAYTTISAWDAAEENDLVTATDQHLANIRSSGGTADTTGFDIDNWTTNATFDITLDQHSNDPHGSSGVINTSAWRHVATNTALRFEEYLTVVGLQFDETRSTGNFAGMLYVPDATVTVHLDKCIAHMTVTHSPTGGMMVIQNGSTSAALYITNTIALHTGAANSVGRGVSGGSGGTTFVYNCTIYNCDNAGVRSDATSVSAKNNAVFSNADDFSGGFVALDYNASDDGDGTNSVSPSNWATVFEDFPNYDFSLKVTDTELIGAGVDDPGSGLYSDDINGEARTSTWDIGADEFVAPAAAAVLLPGPLHRNQLKHMLGR